MVTQDAFERHRLRRRYGTAEAIADELRADILRGEIREGAFLPKLDELTERFRAGKVTVREALRILETEGLLTVQRGNIGGAVAHLPSSGSAAYTLSLVFEAGGVTVEEVAGTIERLEPICAELCAARADRGHAVLPLLVAAQARLADCIQRDDRDGAARAARDWHAALVGECGNRATAISVGAMQAIWVSHVESISEQAGAEGDEMSDAALRQTYDEHAEIQRLIAAGDIASSGSKMRSHMTVAQPGVAVVTYPGRDERSRIQVERTRARLAR
jgi:GntR family transcriptional regulator, transcriptional repressor for pyruvate dehydrogenase complex